MENKRRETLWRWLGVTLAGTLAGLLATGTRAATETELRELANRKIEWHHQADTGKTIPLQLLAINDFHSQITAGEEVDGRPVGSAPVLAAYLKAAAAGTRGKTFILHAGDHVGASQPQSALLQDEPGIMFFNMLGNAQCRTGGQYGPGCNLVGAPGNHELDAGLAEMLRLIRGGNHAQGPYLQNPYQGANFPYICANLVDAATGQPLFAPYVVRMVEGVPVGFIGAILHQAGAFLSPDSLEGLKVLDEAETINRYVRELQAQGVHAMVAVMHQGGYQQFAKEGLASPDRLGGDIAAVVKELDDEVDVVLSGHTHTFHNILAENNHGKKMLVVQAWPKGTGYADIHLELSRTTSDVVAISSQIVTTWADRGPGLKPDAQVAALMNRVEDMGNAIAEQVIANAARPITRAANEAGESALGDLVADAHRQAMGSDFAFINSSGIHADISPGGITKGDHYTVQPSHLNLIKLELTGQQIYDLLNQQWSGHHGQGQFLQVSGLTYTWDANRPPGRRVVAVKKEGKSLQPREVYTVTVNEYLAGGGDNFTVLTKGTHPVVGPFVAEALIQYVQAQPQPINADIAGRISRLN